MKKLYTGKSAINGTGIFVGEPVKKGEHIAFIQGAYKEKKTKNNRDAKTIPTWYGITDTIWIDPGKTIWRFFNHSCDPNTAIVGTKKLVARKNIKKDEEITFDYSMTDGDLYWEMPCTCGAKNCRKVITSIQRIPEKTFRAHFPLIPKYFVKLRKRYQQSATM